MLDKRFLMSCDTVHNTYGISHQSLNNFQKDSLQENKAFRIYREGSLGKIYTYGGLLLSYITLALFHPFLSRHLGLFSPYHTGFLCIFYLYHTCGNFAIHISHLSLKVVPHFTWFFLPFVCFASDQNTCCLCHLECFVPYYITHIVYFTSIVC